MTKTDKLSRSFRDCRSDFPLSDFLRLLAALDYVEVKLSGQTGGSRRRYAHRETGDIILFHESKIMGPGMVKRLREEMIQKGLI